MGDHRLGQLARDQLVTAHQQLGLEPVLERHEPALLEPARQAAKGVELAHLGQRRASPQAVGRHQQLASRRRVAALECGTAPVGGVLEAPGVDLLALDDQPVAGRLLHEYSARR